MELEQLLSEAKRWTEDYKRRNDLGSAEELQMLSCAYSTLFLTACANKSKSELAEAHKQIAECFKKLGDSNWSNRHLILANGYMKTGDEQ